MSTENVIYGITQANGDDLNQRDINSLMNLYQVHAKNPTPTPVSNALSLLKMHVNRGDWVVTSQFFYAKFGNKRFHRVYLSQLLSKQEQLKVEHYVDIYNISASSKTEEGKQNLLKQTLATAAAAIMVTGASSIEDITPAEWKKFIRPLRTEDNRWKKDFLGIYQIRGIRALAWCLSQLNSNDPSYLKLIHVKRSDKQRMGEDLFEQPPEHLRSWVDAWKQHIEASGNYTIHSQLTTFYRFSLYLEDVYLGQEIPSPTAFFCSQQRPSFIDWIEQKAQELKIKEGNALVDTVNYNNRFSKWFIDLYLSDAGEDGEKVSPAFPLVRESQFQAFKNKHGQSSLKPDSSTKEVPPLWLRERLKELLTEDDYAWPKSLTSEYTDSVDEDGNQIWIPTITYLYLIMLEIPVRRIQLTRSDSGEGDVVKYDRQSDKWVPNNHPSANHWRKDPTAKVENRGILREHKSIDSKGQNLVIYLNSNKTQDKNVGFTELSGYEIPWKHPEVIRLVTELREWQEEHNPCSIPVRAADVPDNIYPKTLNDTIAKGLPDRFFLFRSAKNSNRSNANCFMPPVERSFSLFWNAAMDELERRLQAEGLDIQLVLNRNKIGQAQEVLYTPHSLRVAGLTSLAEQGVPIEVLSKLVAGHKSIFMTVYYIKHDYAHITEVLNEASHKILLKSQEDFARWIQNGTWEQVSKYAAYNSEESAEAITGRNQKAVACIWNATHLGLCPYGGTRCHDGGEMIRKKPLKHAPVKEKDCVNCRHLITGKPWLMELTVHGNKLLLDIERKIKRTDEASEERHKLQLEKRNQMKANNERPSGKLRTELNKLNSVLEKLNTETDELIHSLHATHNLIEKIKRLPSIPEQADEVASQGSESASAPSLLISSDSSFALDYKESPTNFATLDYVVQASRLYVHDRNKDYERERDEFMNIILLNNGFSPLMMLPVSEEEKRSVADEFAKLLVTRASGEQMLALKEGRMSLQELGVAPSLPEPIKPLNLTVPTGAPPLGLENRSNDER